MDFERKRITEMEFSALKGMEFWKEFKGLGTPEQRKYSPLPQNFKKILKSYTMRIRMNEIPS